MATRDHLISYTRLLTPHHNGVYFSVAQKRKPTYHLDAFKAASSSVERLRVTATAVRTATALGFDRAEIVATIQTMQRSQFYKSTTAYADHRVWQDV